jgi:hypothetical protein
MVLELVSEDTMSLKPGISIKAALLEFKDALLKHVPSNEKRLVFLKHPASAPIIPQICEVFDTKLIYLLRSMKDIEVTRQRRKWAIGAPREARIVYSHMFDHLVNRQSSTAMVRYADLIKSPVLQAKALAAFCDLKCDQRTLEKAASFISSKA